MNSKTNLLFLVKSTKSVNVSSCGFTMLEMLVVVFIISIGLGIVAPTWLAFVNTRRLNVAQNQVYQAMREAQRQARKEKLTYHASFREQNNILQWAVHPATMNPSHANWNNLDPAVQLVEAESTLDKLPNNVRRVQFDYIGSVPLSQLSRITLSSKSSGKIKRCVFVSTILGAMRTAKENSKPDKTGKYCY